MKTRSFGRGRARKQDRSVFAEGAANSARNDIDEGVDALFRVVKKMAEELRARGDKAGAREVLAAGRVYKAESNTRMNQLYRTIAQYY